MDIVLVNPNNRILSPYAAIEPPLWLGLVAQDLKLQRKEVAIVDAEAMNYSVAQTSAEIRKYNPKEVLIVVMGNNPSVSSTPKMLITKILCDNLRDLNVSVTGLHPSALPKETEEYLGVSVLKGKIFEGCPDIPFGLFPMSEYRAHFWHCLDGSPRSPYASVYTSLNCPFSCVVEGTPINVSNSRQRPQQKNIEDIYNTNTKIKGFMNNDMVDVNIAHGKMKVVNELMEISLPDSRKLLITPEHLIYTKRGYVRADELTETDELLTAYTFFKDKELRSCAYCDKTIMMRVNQKYCSNSCKAKAQPRDYAKGDKSVAKRPEVKEKIRQSKIGDRNPMKRQEVVDKMKDTSLKNGCYIESGIRMERLQAAGKITKPVMTPEGRKRTSERMKNNNPMLNPIISQKVGETHRMNYALGIIPKMVRTPEQRKYYSESKKGEKNPLWRGGSSDEPYINFGRHIKEVIRERDGYRCQLCGKPELEEVLKFGFYLVPHHIDYNKKNPSIDNLITLCRHCNARVNYDREYWQQYFTNKSNGNKEGICVLSGRK